MACLNDTLTLPLDNCDGINLSNRTKRGLIDDLGQLSRMLFGTATNEGVLDLKEKLNHLTSFASAPNKFIHLNSQNIKRLEQQVQDIASYTNILKFSLNTMLVYIRNIYSANVVVQALAALQNVVNSFLHTNSLIVQNIVDTARGRVTSSLFPVKNFLKVLNLGENAYKLTPLFDHYYPLLKPFLMSDSVVIHVPFKSGDAFEV